ncbi:hypothetical protein [Mucilaginibacter segetis]|uniref:Uncharacterized protein n=1 Tax=Mucilaginibacter segetis TaxID=2793071 RepID=A0A934UMX5_9SPHI|nr:hypothetical protein [Mucilaginibacter segetis]MBK0379342.1 hypothetical protein [Mucilaginibacter segetis]
MIYFSNYFRVQEDIIDRYGAFNISLINDLPLFIDPFLLFGSQKKEYQQLHKEIVDYLIFLREKAALGNISDGEKKAWFMFPEVEQTWLGFSVIGNSGRGLGPKFANSLSINMPVVFADLGEEKISQTSHLEKAALFQIGIGKDNISDFTTNLIKRYLLEYTEKFTLSHIAAADRAKFKVDKVYFDYDLKRWMPKEFTLPLFQDDYVLLTPVEILTKDENWINGGDLHSQFHKVCNSIANSQLRSEVNNYFSNKLPRITKSHPKITQKEKSAAIIETLNKFPKIIDYYIKLKEGNKDGAKRMSKQKVEEVKSLFVNSVTRLLDKLKENTEFFVPTTEDSFTASLKRVNFMKHVIEKNDGYRIFYVKGQPIKREQDVQIIFRLTWHASTFDVNREVNNGRGPVDYAVSKGAADKTLVEFKLASNSQLKKNLQNQVSIYEEANNTTKSITVIVYFTLYELQSLKLLLKELKLTENKSIILIDARSDNKTSASKA